MSHWVSVNATIHNDTVVIDRRFFDDEITIGCTAINPHGKASVSKKLQPLVVSVTSKLSIIVMILGVLGIFGFGFALGIYWPNKHEIAFMSGTSVDEPDCCPTKSESQLPLTQNGESYNFF